MRFHLANLTFPCGCEVPILDEKLRHDNLPTLQIPYEEMAIGLNYGRYCNQAFNLIHEGKHKGIFQLESYLGYKWGTDLQPSNVEELAALTALIRPACLNALIGDKSITQTFVDRKQGRETTDSIHPSLDDILGETYQNLVYQEQAIKIAMKVAGYTEEEADVLRRAVTKKDAALMSSLESSFIEGCSKVGIVDDKLAKQLFEWIRESQQYSFNKCLSPDSIVLKSDGTSSPLQDLVYGDEILTPYGYRKVVDIIYSGKRVTHQIILEKSLSLICTLDHKLLCSDGIVRPLYECLIDKYLIHTKYGNLAIIDCEYHNTIECMDIEIDDDNHLFYANGIATSNSHAVSYSYISYLCAWTKHHFPLHFYASWLAGARERLEKEKEIRELYAEASSESILIKTPSLRTLLWNDCDVCVDNDYIRFGLQCMKKVGQAEVKKVSSFITEKEKTLGPINKWSWETILYQLLPNINSQTAYALITGGVLSHINLSRADMLSQYEKISMITDKQLEKMVEWGLPIRDGLTKLVEHVKGAQKQKIQGILSFLVDKPDDPAFIIKEERALYHVPLTFKPSEIIRSPIVSNCSCKEFQEGKKFKFNVDITIKGEVQDCRSWKIKSGPNKGKTMCSFNIVDDTDCSVSCTVFNNIYEEVFDQLYDTNLVVVSGYRSKTNSLVIKEIQPIY